MSGPFGALEPVADADRLEESYDAVPLKFWKHRHGEELPPHLG